MACLPLARWTLGCALLIWLTTAPARAAVSYAAQGGEYPVAGALVGDQVHSDVAVRTSGGWVVYQDAFTDGSGLGISARRLDGSLSGQLSPMRVNQLGALDQERPRVRMLNDGGAVFAWQGGRLGFQSIWVRFLDSGGTFATGDIRVNTHTNGSKLETSLGVLAGGNVVVSWSSFNQVSSNSLRDVYFQRFTPGGQKLGGEVRVNDYTDYNQRSSVAAPLADGRFAMVWISEQQRFERSVDLVARIYDANGSPATGEILINSGTNACASPTVAASPNGGFVVAWMQKDSVVVSNSWDVFVRPISSTGSAGVERRVNTHLYGDQIDPQINVAGTTYLVIWTSLGQDGSREGVYGQFLQSNGALDGVEFRVNTTTAAQQFHPALASDGVSRFLAVWSGYTVGNSSFDLFAQRYADTAQPLPSPGAPLVSVLSSNALAVSWPALQGFNLAYYEVFADEAASATATTTNNWWKATGLAPSSTHSYRIGYLLADGRRSPKSDATTNTTYGPFVYGGIPYDWMVSVYGYDIFNWPPPNVDGDGDGATTFQEFLAGTNPNDPNSVLRIRLHQTMQGMYVNWNTEPGLIYQLQSSVNLGPWSNVGGPRFAAGYLDSLYVGAGNNGFYRVVRLR